MISEDIFQRQPTHGMLFLTVFAAGAMAVILIAYIKTVAVISDLQNFSEYATRQSLLREGARDSKKLK